MEEKETIKVSLPVGLATIKEALEAAGVPPSVGMAVLGLVPETAELTEADLEDCGSRELREQLPFVLANVVAGKYGHAVISEAAAENEPEKQ